MTADNAQSGSIDIAGATLNFTVEGSGIPILVVGSSIYYPRTFSRELRQSCKIVCMDLPHFAESGPDFQPGSVSFNTYAEIIDEIRSAAGLKKVVIAGHSHHGNVALEYAKLYPEQVSHVVMIGSPPVDNNQTIEASQKYWENYASNQRKEKLRERRKAVDNEYLASLPPREVYVAKYVADAPLYWHNPEYDASWLWKDMNFDMDAIHAFKDLYRTYTLRRGIEKRNVPVLVAMGRSDFIVPYLLWEKVLPELQNFTLKVFEKSGHTPQLEQPKLFNQVLFDWLENG